MKTIITPNADIYVSDEIYEKADNTPGSNAEKEHKEAIEELYKKPDFQKVAEYSKLYGKLKGLEKDAILEAHGISEGKWKYLDRRKAYNVQKWINSVDGKYSGIILDVCNPNADKARTKKSLLIFPFIEIRTPGDFLEIIGEEGNLWNLLSNHSGTSNIILPGGKEITNYTINYELNKLREKVKWQNKKYP